MCGDGVRDHEEECDDANTLSGDGCSNSCIVESGYSCIRVDNTAAHPDVCTLQASCGNGILEQEEDCDPSLDDATILCH